MFSVNHTRPLLGQRPTRNQLWRPGPWQRMLVRSRTGAFGPPLSFSVFTGCLGGVDVSLDSSGEDTFAFGERCGDRLAQRHGRVRRPNRCNEAAIVGRAPDPVAAVVCLPDGHAVA